ncbi:S8/S53 family peptidase [Variovorax sp. ZT5P49]|uniref:S8/S53 family peptidase n=1 Tax=Variovorax sp. ZT5P49 TaxID=3443733 RepID=UPI003F4487A8
MSAGDSVHITSPICLAVLDSGFGGPGFSKLAGDGQAHLVLKRNWVAADELAFDDQGHGTGVLSVAVEAFHQIVLPSVVIEILVQKVIGNGARDIQRNWAGAMHDSLDYFLSRGSHGIILLAAGSWGLSTELAKAVERSFREGAILVTVAHHDNQPLARYPGRLSTKFGNILCVGAVDHRGHRLQGRTPDLASNYGEGVNLVSDGDFTDCLDRDGGCQRASGTSVAAARVAGMVAAHWHSCATASSISICAQFIASLRETPPC